MLQSSALMIRSMTGYGRGAIEGPGLKVTVQLRSVNNRFADLKLRLPDELLPGLDLSLPEQVNSRGAPGAADAGLRAGDALELPDVGLEELEVLEREPCPDQRPTRCEIGRASC